MGGIRGVKHYLQRTAIQGSPTMITAITNVYQPHAQGKDPGKHPFKKHFEELQIGDQLLTESRTITAEDIDRFADLSGDHFYAHIRETDFSGTMFEKQVAHGYLIMSLAAGLSIPLSINSINDSAVASTTELNAFLTPPSMFWEIC